MGETNMDEKLMNLFLSAQRSVSRWLYYGDGSHSWASLVLRTVNRKEDIAQLNLYCLDALRAVYTGKTNIGGLGKLKSGGIVRGRGENVKNNRKVTALAISRIRQDYWMEKYCSPIAMQKVLHNADLYRTIVIDKIANNHDAYHCKGLADEGISVIDELELRYKDYRDSQPDGGKFDRFYATPLEKYDLLGLIGAGNRADAREELNDWLQNYVNWHDLQCSGKWYWQSPEHKELVLLRDWFEE